jgi:hypothetical protein
MTEVVPVTWKESKRLVALWHRHLPDLAGCRFSSALAIDGEVVAVATAGTPSRVWNEKRRIVISRVAVRPGVDVRENACSRLYGSLCGAAKSLGYVQAWTYTLPEEPGTSLRAAGFENMGLSDGGEWDRPSRARGAARRVEPKRRWRRILNRRATPPETPGDPANGGTP